ncbi:MAG: hypothetical protein KG028_07385, partial [Actinobacteria bacterium]|nr:hypothetical protein [Actinomycetota bacterium]
MGTPSEGLQRLRDAAASGVLDDVCQGLGISILVVFGSTVSPEPGGEPGDLDVAVRLHADAHSDLVDVVNALIDLTGTSNVDVLDLARAGVVARARALGPASVPLYEAESGAVALAQMAA